MFQRFPSFSTRSRSEPNSPASPTTRPFQSLYQLPSGSRFNEEEASAVLSSETGSDVTSLSIPSSGASAHDPRTHTTKLQKLRRSTQPPTRSPPIDEDGSSEITSITWITSTSMPPPAPPAPPGTAPVHSISFCPTPHPAESFTEDARLRVRSRQNPSIVLLRCIASAAKIRQCGPLINTSLSSDRDLMRDIIPRRNGFVDTVIEAYNNHRGLIIRPDDVWLAILTQFSFFVNGHSETLRKLFVQHEGKRELVIESGGSRFAMDTASMVDRMTALMETHITDPTLRAWVMPDFTTTTPVDRTACAIVMMGMMKDYFAYKFHLRCGIPKVTLEGERQDWEAILARIEALKQYGIQTVAWYHLLRPILARFVAAYDSPAHPDLLAFWNKIAHKESGSGPMWLSGWITAFCVFSERGAWLGIPLHEERVREHEPKKLLRPVDPLTLTAAQFAAVYMTRERAPYLVLDGFPYPTIESQDVPCGYACVDVLLDDNGDVMETMLIAGSVGAQICSTEKTELFRNGLRDTVRPITAWWYFAKRKEGERNADSDSESD